MFASSTQNYNNEEIDGIVQNHCYSVHSAVESSTGTKLLKMRNPWGRKGEWTGAWSDKWSGWTPQLKNELGATDEDDGLFFIPVRDYLTHYRSTSVAVA